MLGFRARATAADEPRLLDGELADARWFTRAELRRRLAVRLPPPVSIAHRLITAWAAESGGAESPTAQSAAALSSAAES
jgi:NAD+ diphosphatase